MNAPNHNTNDLGAMRHHRRVFRLNGRMAMIRFATMLQTLDEEREALLIALKGAGCDDPELALSQLRAAADILAHGPDHEFKVRPK